MIKSKISHDGETIKFMKKERKKFSELKRNQKALLIAAFLILLIGLLVLLNTIDFNDFQTSTADTTAPYTPDTYGEFYFEEPNYTEDITKNEGYNELSHKIIYTYGSQSQEITESNSVDVYGDFFYEYFTSLMSGFSGSADTSVGFNAFYNEVYFKKHSSFGKFAPQKLYDISIDKLTELQRIDEAVTEEDKDYIGCYLISFEVKYKIYQNDGTFRRDIVGNEVLPQIITLIQYRNGDIKINSVSYYKNITAGDSTEKESLLTLVLPIVWLVLTAVFVLLTVILKKKLFFASLSISALIAFFLSIYFSPTVEIVFFLSALLVSIAVEIIVRLKKKASPFPDGDKQENTSTASAEEDGN